MKKLLLVAALAAVAPACQRGQSPTVQEPAVTATTAISPLPPATPVPDCQESAGAAIIFELTNFQFAPACATGGPNMGLSVTNNGSVLHNFSVEGSTLADLDIQPGQETNTEATGLAAGKYVVFCKYHRESEGMQGELQIK